MVGAYVLTSEIALQKEDLQTAFNNYEGELREYILCNQSIAFNTSTPPQQPLGDQSEEGTTVKTADLTDFGLSVIPLMLKKY